ncbi:hypothetical protein LCGC14_2352700, partial [marine sediment metagenome]
IRQLTLPSGGTKLEKVGLDDYIVVHGAVSLRELIDQTLAADVAFPRHPSPRTYINQRLNRRLSRKESQNVSLAILTELDSRGQRLTCRGTNTPYYFDKDSKRLMPAILLRQRDDPMHETPFGHFLYREFNLSAADTRILHWLASQFTGELPIQLVDPRRVLSVPDGTDEVAIQVSDGQFALVTGDPKRPFEILDNGSRGLLFEFDQVESTDVEELEAEFGPELDAEEAGKEPVPEPPKAKPETEEGGVDVGAILSDIGRGAIELPLQTVGGLRDAAQETMESIDSLAIWLNANLEDIANFEFRERAEGEDAFPEVPQAVSITGGVFRGIMQFVFGMIGAGKVTGLSKLKNLTKLQTAGRLGIQGAIADGIARDPNEENLANLLRELTDEQESAVLNLLASDPDDSEGMARLKKSFEGAAIGALVDAVILSAGAYRAVRGLKTAAEKAKSTAVGRGEGRSQAEIDALVQSTEAAR